MINKIQKLNARMLSLFVNRNDAFARQFLQKNGKKGFRCIKESLHIDKINDHIQSKEHLGVYQLDLDSFVKWGCFDFDKNTIMDFEGMKKLYSFLKEKGFNPLPEKSGGGDYKVHIWILSDNPIPSKQMRLFLETCCKKAGVKPHEIFPKQDIIQEGEFGNLVKLPLGEHLVTKKKSVLLDDEFNEITDQDKILEKIEFHFNNKDTIPIIQEQKEVGEFKPQENINPNEYDTLFNKALNTNFPDGSSVEGNYPKIVGVNDNLLKNEAIWFYQKGYTIEKLKKEIKPIFDKNKWVFSDLLGWFKKAQKGDIKKINKGELYQYLKTYSPELLKTIPKEDDGFGELELKDFSYFKKLKKPKFDLIEDIVPVKSLGVAYAPPKNLKSLVELEKCICLSSGKKFLGRFKTKKSNCLYVDLENNEFIIKDRWEKLRKFHNIRSSKGLYFLSRDSKVNILSLNFLVRLKTAIKKHKIKYIVIDTLPKATDYDSNSEREVNKIYTQFFKPVIEEFSCSITFLLHTNKSGSSFIGSQAYHGIVDCSFELNKKKGTNKVMIKSDNRIANINFGVEFEFTEEEIRTYLLNIEQDKIQAVSKLKELTEKVRGFFNESSRLQKKDIEIRLENESYEFSRATLTRVLKFLYEAEFLDKDTKGVYWLR